MGATAGDLQDLYERFAATVHAIVLARVGPEDADDVTQEVFLKLHKSLATARDPDALPGFICTTARNAALDHVRRQARRPPALRLVEDPPGAAPAADRELGTRVLELIGILPESYRETLTMRLVEGMTGPQIAAATGLTHGSVRVNLTRGMAMLRSKLAKEGWA